MQDQYGSKSIPDIGSMWDRCFTAYRVYIKYRVQNFSKKLTGRVFHSEMALLHFEQALPNGTGP